MPHGAVVAWRRAPALEPAINGVLVCEAGSGPKRTLRFFSPERNQARKNKRAPLMRFHIGFVMGKKPQGNELSRLPQSRFMSVRGAPYTFGMGLKVESWVIRPYRHPSTTTGRSRPYLNQFSSGLEGRQFMKPFVGWYTLKLWDIH